MSHSDTLRPRAVHMLMAHVPQAAGWGAVLAKFTSSMRLDHANGSHSAVRCRGIVSCSS